MSESIVQVLLELWHLGPYPPPCAACSGAHHPLVKSLFLTPNPTLPWYSSILFLWVLLLLPESRASAALLFPAGHYKLPLSLFCAARDFSCFSYILPYIPFSSFIALHGTFSSSLTQRSVKVFFFHYLCFIQTFRDADYSDISICDWCCFRKSDMLG